MSYKVLVVDDEDAVRDLFVELLKKEKCLTEEASNGEDALALIEKEAFNIILLDIKLPGISGLDVLKKIRGTKPDLPVIMITGFAYDDELVAKSKEYGCCGYIVKNMSSSEIIASFKSIAKKAVKK
ncbi:MAG: response regulator [Candidatus Omnitrophota bacterium]